MKKIILSFTVITTLSLLFFSACKKGKEVLSPESKQKLTEQNRGAAHRGGAESDGGAQAFFDVYGPKYESFTIDPRKESRIQLSGGTVITIPPGAYTINGQPVTGPVNFKAIEFTNRGAMALRGINTMEGSTILRSDGSFDIKVTVGSDNTPVDEALAPGKLINFQVPDRPGGLNVTYLYYGGTIESEAENGLTQQQFNWTPVVTNGQASSISSLNGTFTFTQPNTVDMINIDIPEYPTARSTLQFTTLAVNLTNNPGSIAGYQGSGGDNTYVLFTPKGYNSLVQLYNNSSSTHVESFPNSITVGMPGRLLAYSVVGGNYYIATKDIVTTGPTQTETLTFTPTTAAALTAALNALSTY